MKLNKLKGKVLSFVLAGALLLSGVVAITNVNASAQELENGSTIDIGVKYSCGKVNSGFQDLKYNFTLNKSGKVTVKVEYKELPAYGSLRLKIMDSSGRDMVRKEDYSAKVGGGNSISGYLLAGNYSLSFGSVNIDGYAIDFILEFEGSNESVPESVSNTYDSAISAVKFTGTTMNGQLAINDNADAYEYSLSKDAPVTFKLYTPHINSKNMTVLDADGKTVKKFNYSGSGAGTKTEKLDLKKGKYYVVIDRVGSNDNDTGEYTLTIESAGVADSAKEIDSPSSALSKNNTVRLYKKSSGDHIYSSDINEINKLIAEGWVNETYTGGANTFKSSLTKTDVFNTPVYCVYNPNKGGFHLYTTGKGEANSLISKGWKDKYNGQPVFYVSNDPSKRGVYRAYNPNSGKGVQHYCSKGEYDGLKKIGWKKNNNDKPFWYTD